MWFVLTRVVPQFALPVTIRLHKHPLPATIFTFGLFTLLHPSTTLSTCIFFLSLAATTPHIVQRMRFVSIFSLIALSVPTLLLFLDLHLWLTTGAGNPNYVYFQQLAFEIFLAVVVLDYGRAIVALMKVERITEKEGRERKREKKRKEKEKGGQQQKLKPA